MLLGILRNVVLLVEHRHQLFGDHARVFCRRGVFVLDTAIGGFHHPNWFVDWARG